MTVAIRLDSVSKLYRLGTVGTGTLAHDLNRWWHQVLGKQDPYAKIGQVNDREQKAAATDNSDQQPSLGTVRDNRPEYVWALRDINLEIGQGEIVGIIGRNGAGKSTLLKLLSRVTAPTTGTIKANGRIASLLEVGTGFHPELTGLENIYMNGAILGMRRHEITRRLEEIVEFSGCAKYLETPVKRYSSGMLVRLGFAVAAHLECEILIIDEVLAVGDWDFQKKCVDKMRDVSRSGRTLLFVSHNLGSVRQICDRSIIMSQGTVEHMGDTAEMITRYMNQQKDTHTASSRSFANDPSKPFQVLQAFVSDQDGSPQNRFACNEAFRICMICESREPVSGLYGYLEISRTDGTTILVTDSFDNGTNPLHELSPGKHRLEIPVPARVLGHGSYRIYASFASRTTDKFGVDSPGVIAAFELYDDETRRGNQRGGLLSVAPHWQVRSV